MPEEYSLRSFAENETYSIRRDTANAMANNFSSTPPEIPAIFPDQRLIPSRDRISCPQCYTRGVQFSPHHRTLVYFGRKKKKRKIGLSVGSIRLGRCEAIFLVDFLEFMLLL